MKFCSHCGKEIVDEAVVCPGCGCAVGANRNGAVVAADDAPSFGFAFLGFLWPLAGLIMYLVWHTGRPKRAASAGKGALAGFITSIVIGIIYGIIIAVVING